MRGDGREGWGCEAKAVDGEGGREGGMGRSEGWEMNEWDEVQGGVRGERLEVIDEGWLTKDVRWGRGRLITGKQSEIRGGGEGWEMKDDSVGSRVS